MLIHKHTTSKSRQRGVVAIIVALSITALVGFLGLALDVGHLFITKTELQDAADACALAAARALTCDPAAGACDPSYLSNAENAGITVAARNRVAFQSTPVAIAPADVRFSTTFSPNGNYLTRLAPANPASRYVMCIARRNAIAPWFMQVVGGGSNDVGAYAVASLMPSESSCPIPMGVCMLPGGSAADPFAGMATGQWLTSKLSASATGSFDWIDFTPKTGGGAAELRNLIKGVGCAVPPPPGTLVGQQGAITSLDRAWNTRFGLYHGATESIATAPPDHTGFAYTPTSWPEKFNAYAGNSASGAANYRAARALHSIYQGDASGLTDINIPPYNNSTVAQLTASGSDRRLVTVPVVDCSSWAGTTPQYVPVLAYACVLMLHPMQNDTGPTSAANEVWLEYRGPSNLPNSPCATAGGVGGPGSIGPLVPALVQ